MRCGARSMPDGATAPVLLVGIPSEPPLAMVAAALEKLRLPYLVVNQREVATLEGRVSVDQGYTTGVLQVAGRVIALENLGGVYNRVVDHQILPELAGLPPDHATRLRADRLHETLAVWCEITPGRVVNRLSAQASNASKPYQARLIADFFAVPETLVTNDPDEVLAFQEVHERVIYKSISGARSIVRELAGDDLRRLDRLAVCPVQFQERIDGLDVRVHTLSDGGVFATAIESGSADWRYAHHEQGEARMSPFALDDATAGRCLKLAADLGLDFAGIDLRITPDGETYCFEVNPSPAYSAFEEATGQPISLALARYLAGVGPV
jgi:hypothetical protein